MPDQPGLVQMLAARLADDYCLEVIRDEAADDEKPSVQHMVFGTKLIERDDVGKDSQMGIFF